MHITLHWRRRGAVDFALGGRRRRSKALRRVRWRALLWNNSFRLSSSHLNVLMYIHVPVHEGMVALFEIVLRILVFLVHFRIRRWERRVNVLRDRLVLGCSASFQLGKVGNLERAILI
jgi:hypothetical protein